MAFELVNTIDVAWRTVEDTEYLSCKTVILFYEDLFTWCESLETAFHSLHPDSIIPKALKEAFVELHILCHAKNDERRYRVMNTAAEDVIRRNLANAALVALSAPGPAGEAPNPWVHNVLFGPPQDITRYYREHAPITIPSRKIPGSGKFGQLPYKETQDSMSANELFFFKIALHAGNLSGHCELLQTQKERGWSKYWDKGWRNAMGNKTKEALDAFRFAWKRWSVHIKNCKIYWDCDYLETATYRPSVSAVFHYLGERSESGPTAAAGAHTALAGIAKALKLSFPMDDCTLRGFCRTLKCRQPIAQIPVQVCVQAHFQYVLEKSDCPFLAMVCASPWLSMVGMIRETHAQRSYLVKETDHGYILECTQGKSHKGKPFFWNLPKISWGKDEGYSNTAKMMAALRTSPPPGEEPFLFRQFGPKTTTPFSAKHWRSARMTPHQLALCREEIMRSYPLNMTGSFTSCSYEFRRAFPGLGQLMGATPEEEHALGNWSKPKSMPEYYSDHNLRMSFIIKWSLVKACRITASTIKMTKPERAWNFSWGSVPTYVPDWTTLRAEATAKAQDMSVKTTVDTAMYLPPSFTTDKSVEVGKACSDCSSDSNVSNSSVDDSDDGLAREGHLHDLLVSARSTILAHGKSAKSLVHLVTDDDDDKSMLIKLACNSRLNRASSTKETAESLTIGEHMPCKKCQPLWSDYITGFWDEQQ